MNKELVISAGDSESVIALLQDKKLIELHKDRNNNHYAVGDIYLGKVKKIISGLNAAFVDVGYEKDAFLHYLDLGPQINSQLKFTRQAINGRKNLPKIENFKLEKDIDKTGKITQVLNQNQYLLVQIAKEPISNKGPRLSSEISLPGRFLILVPFSNKISISQKIKNIEERNRLRRLVKSIKPNNIGVIIRTNAENKLTRDLMTDMTTLMQKWESAISKMPDAKPPKKIFREIDRASTILRDLLNDSFNHIHVNDEDLAEELKSYVESISPNQANIVKLYKGKTPIFEHFGVDRQIKSLFGQKVTLSSGTYLIIEHTEAMHVIDVNSGHRLKKDKDQEANALAVNMESAEEIARQLRLRDMGGIIVVDFIDMHERQNRQKLFEVLENAMENDPAKHTILPPTKFGLIQITRQRVRPEMDMETSEKCPVCNGTGIIQASIVLSDEIENRLRYLIQEQNEPKVKLQVHPYLYAYLTKGLISEQVRWFFRYKKWIPITANTSYHSLKYKFFNKDDDEIKI
ncbi:MAG: Rne/Rng family ribonuclease [Bacteroidales bacterium]